MARRLALLVAALGVAAGVAGCGGGGATDLPTTPAPTAVAPPATPQTDLPATVAVRYVGTGANGAWVLRPRGSGERRLPVVLFAHGWFATNPSLYRGWVAHLIAAGNEVVYPTYQTPPYASPSTALRSLVRGVRSALALRDAPVDPATLVAIGHSAGGALIADYAATARGEGLPEPRAIFSAYPGRKLPRLDPHIPATDLARVPAGTLVEARASPTDRTVGEAEAQRIVARTTAVPRNHRRLVIVRSAQAGDHLGPQRDDAASRRLFWAPADRLIARARR